MRTIFLSLLMVSASLAGCFGEEESKPTVVEETVWDFERPELTWYHFADAIDAWGNNGASSTHNDGTITINNVLSKS